MTVQIVILAAVLVAGYLAAHRLLPWLVRHGAALVGIRLHVSPIWARRLRRFRSIRRGYYSFVIVTTLFFVSLFLELLVNDQALLIYYRGNWKMPAVRQWADQWLPFEISHYLPSDEWGLEGKGPVDYREYASYVRDPSALEAHIAREREALGKARKRFESKKPPVPPRVVEEPAVPAMPVEPGPDATDDDRDAYADALMEYEDRLADYEDAKYDYQAYLDDLEYYEEDLEDYEFEGADLGARADIIARLDAGVEAFRSGQAWVVMPLYPYGPRDHILDIPGNPPYRPMTGGLPLGTTDNGRDVVVQLAYGFRVSILFALLVSVAGYAIGILFGGVMGYYGGKIDIGMQRFVEIWGSIPYLYTIIIFASFIQPNVIRLAMLLIILHAWIGITYTIRGEFYREKAKDYVQAAISMGVGDWKIITRHILPNSLVPVVSFAPFAIVADIFALVSLDYLGFGLPPGTPSWGYLFQQGHQHILTHPHLILVPFCAMVSTLFLVVIIGESVREAFDPKVFSRLR